MKFNQYIYVFSLLLQSLERCQLKEVVAARPEKLDALGDQINSSHKYHIFTVFYRKMLVVNLSVAAGNEC